MTISFCFLIENFVRCLVCFRVDTFCLLLPLSLFLIGSLSAVVLSTSCPEEDGQDFEVRHLS